MKALVAKCMRGCRCQFDGELSDHQVDDQLLAGLGISCVAEVCPEEMGGLPTPRSAMQIQNGDGNAVWAGNGAVRSRSGTDCTEALKEGARRALEIAKQQQASIMIGRRRSPSCSSTEIYDGSFTKMRIKGLGVATALLRKNGIDTTDLEQLIAAKFAEVIENAQDIYRAETDWSAAVQQASERLIQALPLKDPNAWHDILRSSFIAIIPKLHRGNPAETGTDCPTDSDTVRFHEGVFRKAYGIRLLDSTQRCRICTYPEGLLDSFISEDGLCSACRSYQTHKARFEDYDGLRALLRKRLEETQKTHAHNALAACSGGKDSTYMMLRLSRDYPVSLMAVMDDLNQQNDLAIINFNAASRFLNIPTLTIPPPHTEKQIRRTFLKAGSSFCRLCLRSHFVRIYRAAIEHEIPYVFFGLSPNQCLDCQDAINWSLSAIKDLETPFGQHDNADLLRRYRHRAFQGGFEVGFADGRKDPVYQEWQRVFDHVDGFVPIMVPFFIFDGYPGSNAIMETLSEVMQWERPEVLLDRTNCRHLRLAGVTHRAVAGHHLNYKERATALRRAGVLLSKPETSELGERMDEPTDSSEAMSLHEFETKLHEEFGLGINDLPLHIQESFRKILTKS